MTCRPGKKRFPALVVVAMVLPATPAGAIDLNPFSLIKGAVEAAAEDRSSGDIATDLKIKTAITAKVVDEMGSDVIAIGADVYEQDVMLTGTVEAASQKQEAGKLARAIEGKINALLLDASGANVTNFRWRSVQGHVFLFGRALSGQERDKAVGVVKDITNVLTVTNRVKVRPKS